MTEPDASAAAAGYGSPADELTALVRTLRTRNPILFRTAAAHGILLFGFLLGLVLDPRTVGGEPVWLKPAKFAASIALVTGTLAWLTPHLAVARTFRRRVSWVVAIGLGVEIVAIGGQAARGTESHFNDATILDTAVYLAMGLIIVGVTLAVAWLFVRAARSGFDVHPAFALGIALGGGLFVVGAFEGGAMIALGTDTVGGGDALPVVGWTSVGDFRIAHFVGLHALQLLPLVGYLAAVSERRGYLAAARPLVWLVGCAYAAVLLGAMALALLPLVA